MSSYSIGECEFRDHGNLGEMGRGRVRGDGVLVIGRIEWIDTPGFFLMEKSNHNIFRAIPPASSLFRTGQCNRNEQ